MKVASFDYTKKIPRAELCKMWDKRYPDKECPTKIVAFELTHKEFAKQISTWRHHPGMMVDATGKDEYGFKVPAKNIHGAVFKNQQTYVIIHDQSKKDLQQAIKHELRHIQKKDI